MPDESTVEKVAQRLQEWNRTGAFGWDNIPERAREVYRLRAAELVETVGAPANWPPTAYTPFVALRSLARWLVSLPEVPAGQFTSVGDIARKTQEVLDRVDAAAGEPDWMAEDFVEANERLGDSLVKIGLALGLPRPSVAARWGAPEILARIAEMQDGEPEALGSILRRATAHADRTAS